MAYIIEVPNPFDPLNGLKKHEHPGGITLRQWLELEYPGFVEFSVPTICVVNGSPVLREQWNQEIKQDDIVNFIALPPGFFLIIIIAIIALIVLTVALPTPTVPGEPPASDPVYTIKGQQNDIRLGEPIECSYGRNRIFPSFAARPYYQYIDNDQFAFSLLCIGQGQYDIEAVQIADTPIGSFEEAEYEIINPGGDISLFPVNVATSIEAGGQTLFAPNDDSYVAPGYVGPFTANASGTTTQKIEVDVIFPRGLYSVNDDGGLNSKSVTLEIQYRQIDNAGSPIGSWTPLTSPSLKVVTAATTTPQRRTFEGTVPAGRYQIRARRTDTKDLGVRAGHDAILDGLRAFLDVTNDFGNVTLLAVKIRATNNLNDRTQVKFNVIATRMISIRETGDEWSALTPSRSIVWATVDVFKNTYGGRIEEDTFFDLETLEALDELFESRGDHFDWTFRDPITVWDAAKMITRVGRAIPLLSGSLITVKRDGPLTVPVTLFNQENITAGSFEWDVKLFELNEYDSLSVQYTEPSTGYKQEQVVCTLPGGTTDNPQNVQFPGIQSRNQAYREGLFTLAGQIYLRENLTFETGMEGLIPSYGDLIAISHDIPRWGQSGYILNAIEGRSGDWFLLCSVPLNWSEDSGADHVIMLRDKNGALLGPFDVLETEDTHQVLLIFESDNEIDFLLSGKTEPMLFVFGVAGQITKYAKTVKIEPQGGERIRITAINDAPIIHTFDSLTAPALGDNNFTPQVPDVPTIANIYVTQVDGVTQVIQVAWTPAYGAQYYVIQTSHDGTNWEERGTTTRSSIQLPVRSGTLYVRVAGVNNGQGAWIQTNLDIASLNDISVSGAWTDVQWTVAWWNVLNATGYTVKVYDNTVPASPILKRTATVAAGTMSYNYTYTLATTDSNLVRAMKVTVDPMFGGVASGAPVSQSLSNAIPNPPGTPSSVQTSTDATHAYYILSWTVPAQEDLHRLKVWVSATNNFDPSVVSPVVDTTTSVGSAGIATFADITVNLTASHHAAQYWRVAVFDVWGNEISTNITAQQTIAAF